MKFFRDILNPIKRSLYLFLILIFFINSLPANAKIYFLEADFYQGNTQEKHIVVGRGEILTSEKNIGRLAITDPSVADLQLLSEKQVFVRGKQLGMTTLLVWEKNNNSPARFEVSVIPDIEKLKKQLKELDENIEVEYMPPATTPGSLTGGNDSLVNSTSPTIMTGTSGSTSDSGDEDGETIEDELSDSERFPTLNANSTTAGTSVSPGRLILRGEVKNADVIAKALHIAAPYVNDSGINIISQAGGQIISGPGGTMNNLVNVGTGGAGSSLGGLTDTGISFTTNQTSNLNRGVIVTTTQGRVLSFLVVKDQPQIAVTIRFYEISRSLTRSLGLNANIPGRDIQAASLIGGPDISTITGAVGGVSNASNVNSSAAGQGSVGFASGVFSQGAGTLQGIGSGATAAIFDVNNGIGLVLQALQERGEVKTLSEPTLVIANGEPASFLAGGEVPVQRSVVVAGGATQNISFEPFGIKVTILPTITADGTVHLQLVPEIREIDDALSDFVSPAGGVAIRPPAFRTRRTQTQVELMSGQAFAISGLLNESNTRSLSKMPGVADIPILGSLFRSKSFRRGESELLIVVSPSIVKPVSKEKIAELSIEKSPPDREFNYLAPIMRPYVKLGDEIGPNGSTPINPERFYMDGGKGESINPIRRDEELEEDGYVGETQGNIKQKIAESVKLRNKEIKDTSDDLFIAKKKELAVTENLLRQKSLELVQISKQVEQKKSEAKVSPEKANNKEIEQILQNLEAKKEEIVQVSRLLRERSEVVSRMEDEIELKTKKVAEVEKILEEKDKELKFKSEKIKKINEPLVLKSKEIEKTERELELKQKEIQRLEALFNEKNKQILDAESTLAEKSEKIKKAEIPLNEKNEKILKLERELKAKSEEIKRIESTLNQKLDKVEEIEEQLKSKKTKAEEIEKPLLKTSRELKQTSEELKGKMDEVNDLEAALNQKNIELRKAEEVLKEKSEKIKKAELPVIEKNKQLMQVSDELKLKASELSKVEKLIAEKNSNLLKAEEDLKLKIKQTKKADFPLKRKKVVLSKAEEEIKEKSTYLSELEKNLSTKEIEIQKAEAELKEKAEKIRLADIPLEEKNRRLARVQKTLDEKTAKMQHIDLVISEKSNQVVQVDGALSEKSRKVEKVEKALSKRTEAIEKIIGLEKEKEEKLAKSKIQEDVKSEKETAREKLLEAKSKEKELAKQERERILESRKQAKLEEERMLKEKKEKEKLARLELKSKKEEVISMRKRIDETEKDKIEEEVEKIKAKKEDEKNIIKTQVAEILSNDAGSKEDLFEKQLEATNDNNLEFDNSTMIQDVVSEPVKVKPKTDNKIAKSHKVKNGESLWQIVRMYYVNPSQEHLNVVMKINNLINPEMLHEGQNLVIPELKNPDNSALR